MKTPRRLVLVALVIVLLLLFAGGVALWYLERIPKPYDSARIAAAETRMWEAYYRRDIDAITRELTILIREQFKVSEEGAREVAGCLARAAGKFELLRNSNYDETVLPDLEKAYTLIKDASGRVYDAREAAQAELDWWVIRRKLGEDGVDEVGKRIAKLYAILLGKTNEDIERAGQLRAKAACLRETNSDWAMVQRLLEQSYASLLEGM